MSVAGVARVVASAEEWPEVPGARIVVQREGDFLPRGFWRVLSRVIPNHYPNDVLLVAPMPAQAWWARSDERGLWLIDALILGRGLDPRARAGGGSGPSLAAKRERAERGVVYADVDERYPFV